MSSALLGSLMQFAQHKTGADRALAVDTELAIVVAANIPQADVFDESRFGGMNHIRQAVKTGEVVVANNAVSDATRAPVTKTSFTDLRVIVVIPLAGIGAIYVDQPLRKGMFAKDVVQRLAELSRQLVAELPADLSDADLEQRYQHIRP